MTTVGMLQYRLGKYDQAIKTLALEKNFDAKNAGVSLPACVAIIAMAHHRLGRNSQANAALARLRALMKPQQNHNEKELRALLTEAEALLKASRGTSQ